ncbi:MAG TPA: hypothetical protein PKC78_09130 [Accumulibacter sp.]|uniref:hypothetical protein n=1 Tax=Accumulibacter sp. TaxID=2053492 RepID=UPI002C3DA283|nr:hypothetical protein [Accumulibacter sp.]HMW80519.1 hypothetical protein [Accumulibacter sp.]HNI51434.1 hypothetical protein [Accumulibacter sp.]HNJ49749.1 hypothetical protein [Accumulibacter sp.]
MSTSGSDTSNKAALRASLKKEDESLGERLAASELPLLVPPDPEVASAPAPIAEAPVTPLAQVSGSRSTGQRPAAGKGKAKAAATDKTAGKTPAPAAGDHAAPVKGAKKSAPLAKADKTVPPAKGGAGGKKSAKPGRPVEPVVVTAKGKRDKAIRLSVEILQSEEAAIEGVRANLAKLGGCAASRGDILRAGIRLFAEQSLEQMRGAVDGLTRIASGKGKKRG